MKKLLFALLCILAFSLNAQEISIIPKPAEMSVDKGELTRVSSFSMERLLYVILKIKIRMLKGL